MKRREENGKVEINDDSSALEEMLNNITFLYFFISSFALAFVYLVFPQEKRNKFIKNEKKNPLIPHLQIKQKVKKKTSIT